jgi:hypothetical protein
MRYVHSLVQIRKDEKKGWCAPAEMGEQAPHYVNFAIPVGDRPDDRYTCEFVRAHENQREIIAKDLIKEGRDSFFLTFGSAEIWFVIRPVAREDRSLPYLGRLTHPDFAVPFVEIEPENPAVLDQLFLEQGVGILGCDPFTHYAGLIKQPA